MAASSDSDSNPLKVFEYEYLASKIIAEVRKRPLLYDSTRRKCPDKIRKAKLWNQVYATLFNNWNTLSEVDKKKRADLVQKKWRNIRDAFSKELTILNSKTPSKKKKYVHFDALSFLMPKKRKHSNNQLSYLQDDDTSNDSFIYDEDIEEPNTSQQMSSQNLTENGDYRQQTLENRGFDKDIAFSEMVVPKLRKLNDQQKHYARVEIMTILYKARSYPV